MHILTIVVLIGKIFESIGYDICSEAYSCASTSTTTNETLYCWGWKSCIHSNKIKALALFCGGSFSCEYSDSIFASYSTTQSYQLYCGGIGSCENSGSISSNSLMHCGGPLSCANTPSIKSPYVACDGESSCSGSTIIDAGSVYVFGAFSGENSYLINSLLDEDSTYSDYYYFEYCGYYSGYNGTVICNDYYHDGSTTCELYCCENGCFVNNTKFYCHSTANCVVDCDDSRGSSCIEIEKIDTNETLTPEFIRNYEYGSGRRSDNDGDDNYVRIYDKYNVPRVTDYVEYVDYLCSNYDNTNNDIILKNCKDAHECAKQNYSWELYSQHGVLCCVAGNACLNSTISILLSSASPSNIDIICTGTGSCYHANIIFSDLTETQSQLKTDGNTDNNTNTDTNTNYKSISNTNSNSNSNSNLNTTIYCSGHGGCVNSTLTNINEIYCDSWSSCGSATITNSDKLVCSAHDSCKDSRIKNVKSIYVSGTYSVTNTFIIFDETDGNYSLHLIGGWVADSSDGPVIIACGPDSECHIHCHLLTSCFENNVIVECAGECNILCEYGDSNCPTVDYNFTWTYETTTQGTINNETGGDSGESGGGNNAHNQAGINWFSLENMVLIILLCFVVVMTLLGWIDARCIRKNELFESGRVAVAGLYFLDFFSG